MVPTVMSISPLLTCYSVLVDGITSPYQKVYLICLWYSPCPIQMQDYQVR
jgi:hypothetical protein